MSEDIANSLKLNQPRRTIGRKLRAIIWTIGIIAVFLAGLGLWIEYSKFRQTEFLVEIKNAGVSVDYKPAPYAWMMPFLNDNTKSLIEFVSPVEYSASLSGRKATKDAIKKALSLPNLTILNLESCQSLDDETVAAIAGVSSLRGLVLTGSKISDNGISLLTNLQQLETLWIDQVPLSEKGLATLLKMSQLKALFLGQNGLDLLEGFRFEVKGENESKSIKVGDVVTFTGSFQSAKIIPATVDLVCARFDSGGFSLNLTGAVTQLKNGTFEFVLKAPRKIENPGSRRITLLFSTVGSPRTYFQAVKEFDVADVAEPPSNPPEPEKHE